jgi:hypothetical protein
VKHLLAVAAAVVALGLLVSCGSDDFGLSAETRSEIDSNWEAQSAFEQAATCEQLQSPSERLKASEKLQEDLGATIANPATRKRAAAENENTAEGMVSYLEAKC